MFLWKILFRLPTGIIAYADMNCNIPVTDFYPEVSGLFLIGGTYECSG